MNWLFNKCRRHETGLSLLAAGALPEDEQQPLSLHLAQCAACRARLESLQQLSTRLADLAEHLPQAGAPESLRRRWMTAVRAPAAPPAPVPADEGAFSAWLTGRRLAMGSLAATWALVLFFRFSAPEAAAPAVAAAQLPSLHEVLMVLKVDRQAPLQTGTDSTVHDTRSPAGSLSPRSQRSRRHLETMEVA
jgi:anti-sigma factor RsiW